MSYFNDYGSWQRLLHDLNLDWIVRRINKNSKDIEELKNGGGITPNIDATASVDTTTGNPSVNVSKDIIDDTTTFNFSFSGLKGQTGPAGPAGPSNVSALYNSGINIGDINGTNLYIPGFNVTNKITTVDEAFTTSYVPYTDATQRTCYVNKVYYNTGDNPLYLTGMKHVSFGLTIPLDADTTHLKLGTFKSDFVSMLAANNSLTSYGVRIFYDSGGDIYEITPKNDIYLPRLEILGNELYLAFTRDVYAVTGLELYVLVDMTYM